MKERGNIEKEGIIELFKEKKILTLADVSNYLKCNKHSAKYHIKKHGALTCFNHNSKYYSIPEIMNFDENGLWKYDGVYFSKYGTLKETIIAIVKNSISGIAGEEFHKLMKCSLSSILPIIVTKKQLKRKKISGRYVYFAAEENIFNLQYKRRQKYEVGLKIPFAPAYILSLAERIKKPQISVAEIHKKLKSRNIFVGSSSIQDFFSSYNIDDKISEFDALVLLRTLLNKMQSNVSLCSMFADDPIILFNASDDFEQCCGGKLKQHKTRSKKVYTLHVGGFTAYEKLVRCNICGEIYKSQKLATLIPEGSKYGYDVIIYIGEATFLRNRQAKEIQTELAERNISISSSEVEYLAKKFIIYLSVIHEENNTGIVEMMNASGGYILHIDALGGTKGGERLISGVDSISDFVLGNSKIKSENSFYVKPFLGKIKDNFGTPLAVVQDMGKGIAKAVEEVFPDTPILICHFHFLRDIGKDILEANYDIIRKRLRHFGFLTKLRKLSGELKFVFENLPGAVDEFYLLCQNNKVNLQTSNITQAIYLYTLIEWILDWQSDSNGYGFPFDRPHFDLALRIKKVCEILEVNKYTGQKDTNIYRIGLKLKTILEEISQDDEINKKISEIICEIQLFDKLRIAMRIAEKEGKNGLNDDGEEVNIKTIEQNVTEFIYEVEKEFRTGKKKNVKLFIKQLNKYKDQLFSDPITVTTPNGIIEIQPQRTNNLMERMFRDFSRANKRKTGVDAIGNTVQAMVADTPLVRNLKNKNYRKIIIGDNEQLEKVFADVSVEKIRAKMKEQSVYNEKIPKKIKTLLQKKDLLDILIKI